MLKQINFKNTIYTPALAELGGKLYIVPGYIEVPKGTTLYEVLNQWVPWFAKKYPNKPEEKRI